MKTKRFIRIILENILPNGFLKNAFGFFAIFVPPKKSYSQKGEDLIVHAFFGKRKNGYYLDIGSFHPTWISNTHLFHKHGWKGTVVDIDQYKLDLFKLLRKTKVQILRAAVIPRKTKENKINVYKFFTKRGWSDVDTLDFKTAEKLKNNGRGEYLIEKIQTIDINSLLNKLPKINFLNIDIEGLDTKVVNAIDFDKFEIDVILFEDNDYYGGQKKLIKKLEEKGYFHLFTSGGSVCYALKEKINNQKFISS